jgi:hypothetical protein
MRRATHKRPSRGGGAAQAGAILPLDSDDVCGKNNAMFTTHDWEWIIYTTYKLMGMTGGWFIINGDK